MVGRVPGELLARGRIVSVREIIRKCPVRPKTTKRPHARRKPKDVVFEKPGDVARIDTMSVTPPFGRPLKHFDAYDPVGKWTVAQPRREARAKDAASFLEKVLAEMPWPVKAIQIDGGSEFMAEFEKARADKGLPLYVPPPRSRKLNGGVERCNQAWRYEFHGCVELPDSLEEITREVDRFQHKYNHVRPHGALGYTTPASYLRKYRDRANQDSHM